MAKAAAPPTDRRLAGYLRFLGVAFVGFFGSAFMLTASDAEQKLGLVSDLTVWGQGGEVYVLMISIIYVVWGVFLWRAASDPAANRTFIDFTIAANVAHFSLMLVAAIVMPGEHVHLVGDVLAGFALIIPLAVLWIPVLRRAAS